MQFTRPYTLAELAQYLQGTCEQDRERIFWGVATLKEATPKDISFLTQAHYAPQLMHTQAGGIMLAAQHVAKCSKPTLVVADPHVAFAKLMALCIPEEKHPVGVHPQAFVAQSAFVAKTAFIDAQASIGAHATIGEGVRIGPGVAIGEYTQIGEDTQLFANVTVYHQIIIGKRCIIHSGAVIGADGFGFANDKGRWIKVPQLANVEIGDDVEIGANTAIDRGVLSPTRIGNGVKIDNLVQIGHNVQIGDHTVIAGCVAIAGSTTIGKHCAIGGAACISGHIQVADLVQITAMTGVGSSITEPGIYSSGMPAVKNAQWRKNIVSYFRLPELMKRVRALEKDK